MEITHHDFLFWTWRTMNSSWKLLSWASHTEKATGLPWEGFWASENSETQLFRAALSTVTATRHVWPRTLNLGRPETSFPQSRWSHVAGGPDAAQTAESWASLATERALAGHREDWITRLRTALPCFPTDSLCLLHQLSFAASLFASISSHLLIFFFKQKTVSIEMCFEIRAATGDSKYECSGLRGWILRPAPGAESLAVPSDPCCRSVTRLTGLRPAGSQRCHWMLWQCAENAGSLKETRKYWGQLPENLTTESVFPSRANPL